MGNRQNQIVEDLLTRIFHGEITSRQSLVEQDLGVSRTIREALIVLGAMGIVKRIPNIGSFVHVPSLREAQELLELRAALEGVAAAWVCAQVSPEQLQVLENLARRADETLLDQDMDPVIAESEMAFHGLLVGTARNKHLGKTVQRCMGMLALARFHYDASALYALPVSARHHEGIAQYGYRRCIAC